jgi:tRNA A-37 threonylcarbamoyl transferase component Bud32/TolB-like protein
MQVGLCRTGAMTVTDVTSLGAALAAQYTLERELGRGGMATVYLAHDLRHDRRVALKVLHPELAATLGPERFQREIRLAARLSHPNILPVFDSGEAAGRLWYAMPYVAGESLRQRLGQEAQLGVAEVVRIAGQVAAALAHAHGRGIVHRDIKPENILLSGDQALVADFGIAKLLDAASGEPLTETGLSLGTPAYMSPEQGSGGRVDARSDVYALGCVVYEMLAGTPPFTGPTAQAILARHAVDEVPPLRTVRMSISAAVEHAVTRALEKVPADRFASATAFAEALGADHGPPPANPRLSARSVKLALGLVVGTVTASGAVWLSRPTAAPAVVPSASSIAVLPFVASAGDTALVRLGRDLAVTVSASLSGVGGVRTADRLSIATATANGPSLSAGQGAALARRLGASSVLRGTLVGAGTSVRLDLGLYTTEGLAPLAEGITVTADRDSIGVLTDSVTWALLRQIWQRGEPPSPSLASVTTRSLPAVRAFLTGERELGANQWNEARLAFQGAIAADSAFWLAHFRLALVQYWTLEPVDQGVVEKLRLHQVVLSDEERLLLEAFLTLGRTPREKLERHALVTRRFPNYWPGWFLYADALYHWGPVAGREWTEGLEAFHRVVALNPKLVPAWAHIFDLTVGRDPPEASRAFSRLTELGWLDPEPPGYRLNRHLLAGVGAAAGRLTPKTDRLMDSFAEFIPSRRPNVGAPALAEYITLQWEPTYLLDAGFAAAQLELNRRVEATGRLTDRVMAAYRASDAWAWAARGRWDSAITIMDAVAAAHPGDIAGKGIPARQGYVLAVLGAWVGATAPALADQRRPAAVTAIGKWEDEASRQEARGYTAWLDGVLAFARGDRAALRAARKDAAASGSSQRALVGRSLAAFDRALAGDTKTAGHELAALEDYCLEHENCDSHVPHFAVQRLAAAPWLLESGDVEQASRLLRWQDQPWDGCMTCDALGGLNFLARARIEIARGDSTRAREYYQRLLRRYDRPMPTQVHLMEEAKAALAGLEQEP